MLPLDLPYTKTQCFKVDGAVHTGARVVWLADEVGIARKEERLVVV
jgi:hypothetical protein